MTRSRRASRVAALAAALRSPAARSAPPTSGPSAPVPADVQGSAADRREWLPAAPADTLDARRLVELFGDPMLDRARGARSRSSNQNVAAAVAAYAQAQALVREQRAALFPTRRPRRERDAAAAAAAAAVGTRQQRFAGSARRRAGSPTSGAASARSASTARSASAQASAADLAAARLSAQGELATNYFALREADAEIALLARHDRGLRARAADHAEPLRRRHRAKTDVLQAQTQLANDARRRCRRWSASARALRARDRRAGRQGAGRLHARRRRRGTRRVPAMPLGVPSTLLQRRPDIAAAERAGRRGQRADRHRSASAYFPSLGAERRRSAPAAARVGDLFSAVERALVARRCRWRRRCSTPARRARASKAPRPRHDAAVARYRQTVLTAFQGVEDQLATRARWPSRTALRRAGLGRRRPDRAADPQPLPRRPGQLHRGRHRAGVGAERAARAGAGCGRPAGQRRWR